MWGDEATDSFLKLLSGCQLRNRFSIMVTLFPIKRENVRIHKIMIKLQHLSRANVKILQQQGVIC